MNLLDVSRRMMDIECLDRSVMLARYCDSSLSAYSVGSVVVSSDGLELATGYSRERDRYCHAEEAAIGRVHNSVLLVGASLYTSMEPCSARRSSMISCTDLILSCGIGRVVFAAHEPDCLAICEGRTVLERAGVEVVVIDALASDALEPNTHILNHESHVGGSVR